MLDYDKNGKHFEYLKDSYFKCLHHDKEEENDMQTPCGNIMDEEVVLELLVTHELYSQLPDLRSFTNKFIGLHYVEQTRQQICHCAVRPDKKFFMSMERGQLICLGCQKCRCLYCFLPMEKRSASARTKATASTSGINSNGYFKS